MAAPLLGAALCAQTQPPAPQPVERFWSASGLEWSEPANPTRYFDAIGRRAAVFGKQDGRFEAWLWPIKVLHGFRLEFQLERMPEPVRGENYLQSVTVRPESTTLLYVHPNFTVKQTIWAADDRSAIVLFFDVDSDRPLSITAKFVPDFKPMWPAAMGGQHSGWLEEDKAFTLSDGTYKPTAVIGSPASSANTEFMDHSLIGGEMLLRISTSPAEARHRLYPLVMTLSMTSEEEARSVYRDVLAHAREIYELKTQHWRDFLEHTLQLETPDADLNRAFTWAKVSIEQGWVCTASASASEPGQSPPSAPPEGFAFPANEPCGVVAGYGPAGDGERPGFAWWFGGDGLMATWAMLDYGDFDGALRELRFLKAHQRSDGKMMHEMVQSAQIADWWSKYHFGYMHADTTPMYLYSLGQYWQRTGDQKFLDEFWPSAEKAYAYCVSTLDPDDGLMDNTKSGLGAIEVGVLRGTVKKDVYVQGFWVGGLRAMAALAAVRGSTEQTNDAGQRLEKALATLRTKWRDPALNHYAFGVDTAGQRADMIGNWSAALLSAGGGVGPEEDDEAAVQAFASPELATDWGSRWISNKSPLYDPVSYNNGTAWPFAGGFVAWAQYAHGQPLAGYSTLMSLAHLTGAQTPGGMPEHMVGNRNEPGERSVPHQLFSSWSMVRPVVAGLFGLSSSAEKEVSIEPRLPATWAKASFKHYRAGATEIGATIQQEPGRTTFNLHAAGPSRPLLVRPQLPYGAETSQTHLNGRRLPQAALAVASSSEQSQIAFDYRGGVALAPVKPVPERGAANASLKILNVTTNDKARSVTISLAGLGERTYELDLLTESSRLQVEGADKTEKTQNGYRIYVSFGAGEDFVHKNVILRY